MGIQMDFVFSEVRVWRTEDEIKVWDLKHANKRGKHVLLLHFYNLKVLRGPPLSWINDWLLHVGRAENFQLIYKSAQKLSQKLGGSFFEATLVKAIRIAPLGFVPIKIENDHFKIDAGWETFTVEFENGQMLTPTGKKTVKKFYKWVQEFSEKVKGFDRQSLVEALNSINLKYHPKM